MVFLWIYAEGILSSPHLADFFPSLLEILQGENWTEIGAALTEFRTTILQIIKPNHAHVQAETLGLDIH